MIKNLVVYSSETGNTKLLAEEIYKGIPKSIGEKQIVNIRSWNGSLFAENYYIGFWVNRGSCCLEIIDLLSSIHNSNIALFGTCGLGDTDNHYAALENNARVWISEDNEFLGSYFCQGKMPPEVRAKYESYRGKCDDDKINQMLNFYDKALTHPDNTDLSRARSFAEKCAKKSQRLIAHV